MNRSEKKKVKKLEKRLVTLENQVRELAIEVLQKNIKSTSDEKAIGSEWDKSETLPFAVWAKQINLKWFE